jgi:hypothetical protein
MQKESMTLILLVLLLAGGFWYYGSRPAATPTVSTYPTLLSADQVLVEDTSASSSAPVGFHTLRDTQLNVTFNVPVDWKAQVLPEGDGKPSLISPDFSNPLESMTGAYLHYYFASLPDSFIGQPDKYMALLKQGGTWTDTSLDGHPAFISKSDNGYIMIVSQFGDNWFVTVSLADPGKKYSAVLDEFQRSFHAQ